MADIENKYYQVGEDSIASQPVVGGCWFKRGIALFCGVTVGLVLLYVNTQSASDSAESANLVGLSSQLRMPGFTRPTDHCMLPGCGPYQNLALSAIKALNEGKPVRDVAMEATGQNREVVVAAQRAASEMKESMSGQTAPFGYWDPVGISTNVPEGKLLFFREAELKHGRVAMLASLGILVGEKFFPFFKDFYGVGDISAIQTISTPSLQIFWAQLLIFCYFVESATTLPAMEGGQMKAGYVPGDLGWDPLGLKPKDAKGFKEMQDRELNNGRLAMFATLGMLAEELVTGQKLDVSAIGSKFR